MVLYDQYCRLESFVEGEWLKITSSRLGLASGGILGITCSSELVVSLL